MLSAGRNKLFCLIVLTFLVLLGFLFWHLFSLMKTPMIQKDQKSVIITLDKSASAYQFARLLKEKELIPSVKLFVYLVRAKGLAHQLKAGVYQIIPGESATELLDRIVEGDVITQNFSIIAGTTQEKIAQDLAKAPYLMYDPKDWALIQENHANAEGLLLADTYQYSGGSSSKTLLLQANRNLKQYLDELWAHRAPNLPYKSPYDMLIAASIIEKETAIPEERKLIAGVMTNRIKKGMPLQMDPTVIYGLGKIYKGKLSHKDLQIDSPYNSYRYRGLPPTPIAMIGKEALEAAAHPQSSNYLYFVAKGDGSHQFSETYEQQRKAVYQYQRKDL
ncbi:MAG: endolytic transglycosylase MltG [Legionella sp.]|nr:MAG: endolytic transglycosylase MltG [Legionella sp.]